MSEVTTRESPAVFESPRCPRAQSLRRTRPRAGRLLALALVVAVTGGCADEGGDDLSPAEPEAGEEDTEVVPGEGGPVD